MLKRLDDFTIKHIAETAGMVTSVVVASAIYWLANREASSSSHTVRTVPAVIEGVAS